MALDHGAQGTAILQALHQTLTRPSFGHWKAVSFQSWMLPPWTLWPVSHPSLLALILLSNYFSVTC